MPFFKSTYNIFKAPWEDELFNENWMDSDKLMLPPKTDWDYSRELQIEDIDIWEVLYEASGAVGVYAAWSPYAEFYMIRTGWQLDLIGKGIETYYGQGASDKVYKRCQELGINLSLNQIWVEPDHMWLYQND